MASASRIESFAMFGSWCRIIVFSTMLARVSFCLWMVVECCWGPPLARCMEMRRERVVTDCPMWDSLKCTFFMGASIAIIDNVGSFEYWFYGAVIVF